MKKIFVQHLFFGALLLCTFQLHSQSVGINTLTPHYSAALDINSTTKGLLVSRMDSGQRIAIGNPANGLLVYDTTTKSFWYYKATVWTEIKTGVFENAGGLVRNTGNNATDDFIFGDDALPVNGVESYETLMFFDKSKGAFRSGSTVNSPNWAPDSIGTNSVSFGYNNKAKGNYSVAFGYRTNAVGYCSFASGFFPDANGYCSTSMGYYTNAIGYGSIAMGISTEANGDRSIAMGDHTTAEGAHSTALGYYTNAIGVNSTALGDRTNANGVGSTAMGIQTDATGNYSTALGYFTNATGSNSVSFGNTTNATGFNSVAMGQYTFANGSNSTASGENTIANAFVSTVIGRYNIGTGNTNTWIPTDPLLEIGNGSSNINRMNALTVLKNGTVSFQNYTFPLPAGSVNQVMKSDGSGQLSWGADVGAFENTGGLIRNTGNHGTNDFVFGSDMLPVNGMPAFDTLMFFDKSKGALRAGAVYSSKRWSPDSIGFASIALGHNTMASETHSVAIGKDAKATGINSTALGYLSSASGYSSTCIGQNSFALGNNTIAMGYYVKSIGEISVAMGANTEAYGYISTALGSHTRADAHVSMAIGRYNNGGGNLGTWIGSDPLFEIGNGASTINKSNAMTVLKNGSVSFAKKGIPQNGVNVTDTLMFFDKTASAFRAGVLNGSKNWSPDSTGLGSFSFGYNTKAKGDYSTAIGYGSLATGLSALAIGNSNFAGADHAIAIGLSTIASGGNSVALGQSSTASGGSANAFGTSTEATGDFSTALGAFTSANGDYATSMGQSTQANGAVSTAMGNASQANGLTSTAMGFGTQANGNYATSMGLSTKADAYISTAIGRYNVGGGNIGSWVGADPLFEIGIGLNTSNRSNALTVLKNGNVGLGIATPDADLHIKHADSGGSGGLKLENSSTGEFARLYVASSDGFLRIYFDTTGLKGAFNDVTGVYSTVSDRRLKDNLVDLHFDWSDFNKLQPLSYTYINDASNTRYIGLVAQEVEKIYPELITYSADDDRYTMDYSGFGVISIKAIQEQQKIIEQLKEENAMQNAAFKKENEDLQNTINDLITRVERLEQN